MTTEAEFQRQAGITYRYSYVLSNSRPLIRCCETFIWYVPVTEPWKGPYEVASNVPELVLERLVVAEKSLIEWPGAPIAHLVAKLGRLPIEGPHAPPGSVIELHLHNRELETIEPHVTFYAQRLVPA